MTAAKQRPEPEAPALHIARHHQAAPQPTWADKEMLKAAQEIDEGQFTPDAEELPLPIALRVGKHPASYQGAADIEDYARTRASLMLTQHPRVKEALERLEKERDHSTNAEEYVEKAQMLHELTSGQRKGEKWEGQERWEGEDNENMRMGKILTPHEFIHKLQKVIGTERVQLSRYGYLPHPGARSARVPLLVYNPRRFEIGQDEFLRVGTVQHPCGTEWMMMKFDEHGIPTYPKYLGWRTALLTMIRLGAITEKEAHKAFPLDNSQAASWYRQQLFLWNNQRPES